MQKRITLYADKGKILTNGEAYGSMIHLDVGDDGSDFYEIPREEYDKKLEKEDEIHEIIENTDN